jgi:hypothetical protein
MTARPASLDALLDHVAANLNTVSPVHTALAEQLLNEDTAPTEEAAYAGAAVVLAEHARELAAMIRTEYPGPDADRHVRIGADALERYAARLLGQPTP